MSRSRQLDNRTRWILTALFLMLAVLACVIPLRHTADAAAPSSASLSPVTNSSANWVGTGTGGSAVNGEDSCQEGVNCDTYTLTLTGVPADWAGKKVRFRITWLAPAHDYDLYIHKNSNAGPEVDHSGDPATTSEEVLIDPTVSGTGVYTAHVVYFAVPVAAVDQYQGSATVLAPAPTPTPAPAAAASGAAPRYQVHIPQASLREAGKGLDAGEPTIGVNWMTGSAFFQSYLTTFRVSFDDSCPTTPAATWVDKSAPTSVNSLDPLLWADSGDGGKTGPGRIIVSQLSGTTSLSSYSDDDGNTWLPSEGGSGASGVDHQGIGGGPFHAPAPLGVLYEHAVYYCSQDIGAANCALSLDGGRTYGPPVPIYNINQCAGLHGHPKVGPDGTVYVPNSNCDNDGILSYAHQGVIVSEDNGLTWNVRTVPNSVASDSDPSVDIDKGGRVYLGMAHGETKAVVAVSDDHGQNWTNWFDVGHFQGINNVAFPAVVAGDAGRASFAFFGSQQTGNSSDITSFFGNWYLYIATTYDGGATWHLVNATPNDPIQRGAIWLGGGSPPHRNLLDFFDAAMDQQGRLLVGYDDGCIGGCVGSPGSPTDVQGNSYSQMAAIARQVSGRRLLAAFDPVDSPTVPGAPLLTVRRDANKSYLTWSESNDGGSPITSYRIYRATAVSPEALIGANVGTCCIATNFTDTTADPNVLYFYRVAAINSIGESCGSNAVLARPTGNSCTGFKIVNDPPGDQLGGSLNTDLDIQYVTVSEPYFGAGVNKLVFKMKLSSSCVAQANRQWRFIWNYPVGPTPPREDFGGRYYAGMNTDGSGNPSFVYGIVTNVDASPASTQTPTELGAADAESNFNPATGTITVVLSTSKIGNPAAGDIIGSLVGRTFAGNGDVTVRSTAAADNTSVILAETYQLVGNAACQGFVPPAPAIPRLKVADFDADTRSDIAFWRPSDGNWYFNNSYGSGARQWGAPTDKLVPGDYDGDQKTDLAVWRPDEGNWYIINSTDSSTRIKQWGANTDKPVPADYDGDGLTDIAVFRPAESNWYIIPSSGCGGVIRYWGAATDILVPADYDGDGKTDVAVWRPAEGNWYIVNSSNNTVTLRQWGIASDKPVPADYDGDGKTDLAVWRGAEGNWYIINSSNNTVTVTSWGAASLNDRPVPADYDGDGRADIGVFRPGEGNWYIIKSSTNSGILANFGQSSDVPVPVAYIPE